MSLALEHFKMHYPNLADKIVEHHDISSHRVECLLENGDTIIFSSLDDSFRRYLPYDGNEKTWRKRFGDFLFDTLYEKMISQKELSERTGISEHTISKYINGSVTPTAYNLSKIERALNIKYPI